jgi:hypothetical protein
VVASLLLPYRVPSACNVLYCLYVLYLTGRQMFSPITKRIGLRCLMSVSWLVRVLRCMVSSLILLGWVTQLSAAALRLSCWRCCVTGVFMLLLVLQEGTVPCKGVRSPQARGCL